MTEEQIRAKAPVLMPFQWEEFNGDSFISEKFLELKERFGITTVVETGTCFGTSALWMAKNFYHVVTFESFKKYHDIATNRLIVSGIRNAMFYLCDSVVGINYMLPIIKEEKLMFFLDAHWSESCPLLEELKSIADNGIKPVIVIHDFKVPDHPELGFDSYNGQDFTFDWIEKSIEAIYGKGGYEIEYNSEATGAMRGAIFITPNTNLQ